MPFLKDEMSGASRDWCAEDEVLAEEKRMSRRRRTGENGLGSRDG